MEIVPRWFGVFAVEAGRIVASKPFPPEPTAIKERWLLRERLQLCPEERDLLADLRGAGPVKLVSRDERLRSADVRESPGGFLPKIRPRDFGFDPSLEHRLLLEYGQERLADLKNPSLPVVEGIRSIADMEGALNLLGERLGNWWVDEKPADLDRVKGAQVAAARQISDAHRETGTPADPASTPIHSTRASLADLYLELRKTRDAMEKAVEEEATTLFPNLSMLLGPLLAAKLVAQAGGLDRLAQLPAGTVQVLGAERSFFEHLREGGPPPKFGLLFLHPSVHGAPGPRKGRVARALAGKAAIAARRDLVGSPPLPSLKESLERRNPRA